MSQILGCCTILALVIATNARAQMPKAEAPKSPAPELKAMYEDIEILRRILVKDPVGGMSGGMMGMGGVSGGMMGMSGGMMGMGTRPNVPVSSSINTHVQGAYLKGHGVTYTLSVNASEQAVYDASTKGIGLMSVCIKCHLADSVERYLNPGVPNRAPPKLSDWEKARREVRGEKSELQPAIASSFKMQGICGPGNLTEKILKVLAENGHNFKQLPGAENITVVFTFAPPRVESNDSYRKASAPPTLRVAEEKAALGDLHLKQQKYAEAIASYADAIKELENRPLAIAADTEYDRVKQYFDDAQKLLHGSYTKQAQALLASGKTGEAKDALTKAESATINVKASNTAPAPMVSPHLPAKLLITVPKKALDQHHEGKLTLEQLRKDVEVQTINLPMADKKQ